MQKRFQTLFCCHSETNFSDNTCSPVCGLLPFHTF